MGELPEQSKAHPTAPRIQTMNFVLFLLGTAITIVGIVALIVLLEARQETAAVRDRYEESVAAATDLSEASDYLTAQVRMFVVTGDEQYMRNYVDELANVRRRDRAVAIIDRETLGKDAKEELDAALWESNRLAETELYAMRLLSEDAEDLPAQIADVELSAQDEGLDSRGRSERAKELIFGYDYDETKSRISGHVEACSELLGNALMTHRGESYDIERRQQGILLAVLVGDIALLAVAGVSNNLLIMRPIRQHQKSIRNNEPLQIVGSKEIQSVAESYNQLYYENLRRTLLLRKQAETDGLTGLLNRGSFDRVIAHHTQDIVLIIADVDVFKAINDRFGHETGDRVLKRVAASLKDQFRNTDYVCRIGGDEFAIVLTEMHCEMRDVVSRKLEHVLEDVKNTAGGVPGVTMSMGIAFSATLPAETGLYQAADSALYEAKRQGRNRFMYYEADGDQDTATESDVAADSSRSTKKSDES